MTGHSWGDDWPHWNELYAAQDYIRGYVYKYSLCRLDSKEKWGTLRYSHIYPPAYKRNGPIVQLPFPLFYTLIQGRKYPRYLIHWTSSKAYCMWMRWGDKMLGRAVRKACKKFPNVAKEISCGLRGL